MNEELKVSLSALHAEIATITKRLDIIETTLELELRR